MSEPLPPLPIAFEDRNGNVVARDGIVCVLFIRRPHREIADHIGALFERYCALVGDGTLTHVEVGEEDKPLTSRRRASTRKKLSAKGAGAGPGNEYVSVSGGFTDYDVATYRFEYHGFDLLRPDAASSVELWFPTSFVDQVGGQGGLANEILALVADVPLSSGYCSLAFNYEEHRRIVAEMHVTTPLADLHPGLDVHHTASTGAYIGDHVRGAYWLTLLGPTMLERLGLSEEQLRDALDEPMIEVSAAGTTIAIRAGDELRPGFAEADPLPLIRKVASVLEPITFEQTLGCFGFVTDDAQERFLAWQRRHLT